MDEIPKCGAFIKNTNLVWKIMKEKKVLLF